MSFKNFLSCLIRKLDTAAVPYMISGSMGSSSYGEPRATNDIDIIIDPTVKQLNKFVQSIGDKYYLNEETAFDAVNKRSMFNIIDSSTGWKADLIIRKDRKFSKVEFERRVQGKIAGIDVFLATPEDTILSKLEWLKSSGSDRQYRDALGIAAIQWEQLDKSYLLTWAKELKIEDVFSQILHDAEKLQE